MIVADLRQYFDNLARLVRVSSAAKAADELDHIGRGLAPFQNMSVKDFADFLIRADEFARTGQVSAAPAKGRARSAEKPAPKPKLDASALGLEAKRLYEQAATASVTEAELQALATNLNKLTKDGLSAVSEAIGMIVKKSSKKDEIIRDIRARIEARQGSKQRSGMTSPPSSSPSEASGSETFTSSMGVPVSA